MKTLVALLVVCFVVCEGQASDPVPFRVTPGFTILSNDTPEVLPAPRVKEVAKPAKSTYHFANTAVPPIPAPGPGWKWDSVDGSFIREEQFAPLIPQVQTQTTCVNGQCVTTTAAVQTATPAMYMPAPVMQTYSPVVQAQPTQSTYTQPGIMSFMPTTTVCVNGNCKKVVTLKK